MLKRKTLWAYAVSVLGAMVLIGWSCGDMLFRSDLPVFGDLALHVVPIHWLRVHGLHAWVFGWFSGMPLFRFYFPLPALLGTTLAEIVGLGQAVRILVVLGPLSLPPSAAFLVRSAGGSRLDAAAGGLGAVVFLSLRSLPILGGTLQSAAIGEYSYSIALSLSLLYLGVIWAGSPDWRRIGLASMLLAGLALSHLVVTGAAVLTAAVLLLRRERRTLVIASWILGFLLSAFWAVPFLAHWAEMTSVAWKEGGIVDPILAADALLPGIVAVIGSSLKPRSLPWLFPLIVMGAVGLLFLVFPVPFHPGRGLPLALLSLYVVAAVYLRVVANAARGRRAPMRVVLAAAAVAGLVVLAWIGPSRRESLRPYLGGAEAAADHAEWRALRQTLRRLPPGAVHWAAHPGSAPDDSARIAFFGHTIEQLPLLDDRRVVGGLLQESAPISQYAAEARRNLSRMASEKTEPFVSDSADFDLGVAQAAVLGVRYLVVAGDSLHALVRSRPELIVRAELPSWTVAEITNAGLVEILPALPDDPCSTEAQCRRWFGRNPYYREGAVCQRRLLP